MTLSTPSIDGKSEVGTNAPLIEVVFQEKRQAAEKELSNYTEVDYQSDLEALKSWSGTLILHGLSGSGRTTQLAFFENLEGFTRIIPWTNRPLRPGEVEGREVISRSKDEIEDTYARGGNVFIERYGDRRYFYDFPENSNTTFLTDPTQVGPEMKAKLPKSLVIWFEIPFSDAVERAFYNRGDSIDAVRTRTSAEGLQFNVTNHESRDIDIIATLEPQKVHRLLVKKVAEKIKQL